MASQNQTSEKPTRRGKFVSDISAGLSILLAVLGLLAGTAAMLTTRRWGDCFNSSGIALGLCLFCALGAIVLGHWSKFKPGYWSGYACLIPLLLTPVVAALKPPANPNQASAVGSLRTINTTEITYASTYTSYYSPSLSCLGPPTAGADPTAIAAGLIDSILAGTGNTSEKSGYRFVYQPGARDAKGRITSYSITASPIQPGVTGTNYYYTDQTGVIRQNPTAPASAADSPLAG